MAAVHPRSIPFQSLKPDPLAALYSWRDFFPVGEEQEVFSSVGLRKRALDSGEETPLRSFGCKLICPFRCFFCHGEPGELELLKESGLTS